MKRLRDFIYFFIAASCCLSTITNAQDDLYYSPSNDTGYDRYDTRNEYASNDYYYDEDEGEDYVYHDNDEYDDYYYSSRIRRFHRSYRGFGYYDPCYVDRYWYGSNANFWGSTIYIDPFSGSYGFARPGFNLGYAGRWGGGFGRPYRNFYRPNWGGGWNSWNTGYSNNFYRPNYRNSFYYPTYNTPYCPSAYASSVSYIYNDVTVNNNGNNRSTYYGPRGGRTTNQGRVVGSRSNSFGETKNSAIVNQPRSGQGTTSSNSGYRSGATSTRSTTFNGGYNTDQTTVNSGQNKGSSYKGGKRTGVFNGGIPDQSLTSRSRSKVRPRSGRYETSSARTNKSTNQNNSFEYAPKSRQPRSYDNGSRNFSSKAYEGGRSATRPTSEQTKPSAQKSKKRFWERMGSGDNGFFGSSQNTEPSRSYDQPSNSGSKSRSYDQNSGSKSRSYDQPSNSDSKSRSYESENKSRSKGKRSFRSKDKNRSKSYDSGSGRKKGDSKGKSFNFGGGGKKKSGGVSRSSRSKSRNFSKPSSSGKSKRSGATRSSKRKK